ncbi:MAG: hypothetical protein AB7U95_28905 [Reyranella sp.]
MHLPLCMIPPCSLIAIVFYLALYELEGDDPKALLQALEATRSDRTQNAAFDRESVSLWVFSPIAEKQYSDESDN